MSGSADKKSRRRSRSVGLSRPSFRVALEQRVMFDGAGAGVAVDMATDPVPQSAPALKPETTEPTNAAVPEVAPEQPVAPQGPVNPTNESEQTDPVNPTNEREVAGTDSDNDTSTNAEDIAVNDHDPAVANEQPAVTTAGPVPDTVALSESEIDAGLTVVDDALIPQVEAETAILLIDDTDAALSEINDGGGHAVDDEYVIEFEPQVLIDNDINHVVFVDGDIPDFGNLLNGLVENRENESGVEAETSTEANSSATRVGDTVYVVLDPNADGVSQISESLSSYRDLSSVEIFSHGDDGVLRLGETWLTSESLDTYVDEISGWGDSLADGADLLLFGCDVAETKHGEEFVNRLAELTGTDVAASVDATGAGKQGTDWTLEYTVGNVQAHSITGLAADFGWQGQACLFHRDYD